MTTTQLPTPSIWRAFRAILWRDLFVTGKEFWVFLVQVALQPLFMLFIFAKVLGAGGYVTDAYGHLLLPEYRFNPTTGLWRHRAGVVEPPLRLTHLRYDAQGILVFVHKPEA